MTISSSTDKQTLDYDFLILATGSRAKGDAPFKGVGSTEDTKAARHDFQARVKKAKTIVVAGGGVTGCETAGELAYEYGRQKEIIFVSLSPLFWSSSRSLSVDPTFLPIWR
jgi:NADH dehydrogenase FAD-containing subunit